MLKGKYSLREIIGRLIFGVIIGWLAYGFLLLIAVGFPPTENSTSIGKTILAIIFTLVAIAIGFSPLALYIRSKK